MRGPIFTTSTKKTKKKAATEETKAPKKAKKAKKTSKKKEAPKPALPVGKLYIEPRPYFTVVKGFKEWVGISAGVVRRDVADERMDEDGYWDICKQPHPNDEEVSDQLVLSNIGKILWKRAYRTFTKQKTIKENNDEHQMWLTLAVYTSETTDALVFLDTGMGQAPDVVYGVVDQDGIVRGVINHTEREHVTLVVAPYLVDAPIVAKTRRQLERAKAKGEGDG